MTQENDREYFADRVEQEFQIGDRAASPAIAAIHYELAYRYALLCGGDNRRDIIPLLRCA